PSLDEQQLLERTVRAAVVDVDDLERAAELLEHLVEPGVQARDARGLVEDRDDDRDRRLREGVRAQWLRRGLLRLHGAAGSLRAHRPRPSPPRASCREI